MDMSRNDLSSDFILNDLHILLTELLSQEDAWSNDNDADGLRGALKALTSVKDTDKSLTAACRYQNRTLGSRLNLVQGVLLVGTKLDHVVLCSVDTTSITPHSDLWRASVTLCRLVRGCSLRRSDPCCF